MEKILDLATLTGRQRELADKLTGVTEAEVIELTPGMEISGDDLAHNYAVLLASKAAVETALQHIVDRMRKHASAYRRSAVRCRADLMPNAAQSLEERAHTLDGEIVRIVNYDLTEAGVTALANKALRGES